MGLPRYPAKKEINEDFCAAMLPEPGRESFGAICAIADGVSAGGKGKEAAQTTLTALVLRGQSYTLAHVGDTRAYLLRRRAYKPLR